MLCFWKDLEHMEKTISTYLQYTSKHKTDKTEQVGYMAHSISALCNF